MLDFQLNLNFENKKTKMKIDGPILTKTIHILLPVHNRVKVTQKFIENLKKQTFKNYKLILIDDGSTDGTSEFVKQVMPDAHIIYGKGNLWWGGSLHQGYRWLKSQNYPDDDLVLIINDDTEFEEQYLENAVNIFQGKRNILIGSYCYSTNTGKLIDRGVQWNWKSGGIRVVDNSDDINCLSTRGLFLRLEDFLKLKGFRPITLPHYLSDYEFTIRAKKKGMMLLTLPELKVHTDDTPAGYIEYDYSSWKNFSKRYFSFRNYNHPLHKFFFILFAWDAGFKYKIKAWYNLLSEIQTHFEKLFFAIKYASNSITFTAKAVLYIYYFIFKFIKLLNLIYRRLVWYLKVIKWEIQLFFKFSGSKLHCYICDSRFKKFKLFTSPAGEKKYYCPRCGNGLFNRFVIYLMRRKTQIGSEAANLLFLSSDKGLEDRISKIKKINLVRAGDIINEKYDQLKFHSKIKIYDGILGIDFLYQTNLSLKFFESLFSVLRSGGWAIFGVPSDNFDRYEKYKNFIQIAGFNVETISLSSQLGNYIEKEEVIEKNLNKTIIICRKS